MTSPEDEEPPEEHRGTIRPTGPGPLVGFGVVGLVVGWAVRPLALRLDYAEPRVPLASAALLAFVAAIVGGSAYLTHRAVQRDRHRLAHHQAVNRLVLAKASALAGAFLVGGYAGYALAQLGVADPAADGRMLRSLVTGAAGLAIMVAGLLLEQACRVPKDPE